MTIIGPCIITYVHRWSHSPIYTLSLRQLILQQIAAISLFLATKVEEHSRKLKDIVVACCRVAQKNPNLLVDEQTKDYWRWRDTILLNEDVLLEQLCFDLTIDSPYKILYELLRLYNVHRHHKLRDAAWAFLNDQNMTQLCLLFPSRTIACAALYCAAKHCDISFPDDSRGQAWWDVQNVKGEDLVKAYNYMAALYETPNTPLKSNFGGENIYAGGLTPLDGNGSFEKTRRRIQRGSSEDDPLGRSTGSSGCERVKRKRSNSVERENGRQNGHASKGSDTEGADQRRVKRARSEEAQGSPTAESKPAENGGSTAHLKSDDASEEGEVEE